MTICPFCEQTVSPFAGRADCPHCGRAIVNVPCPNCGLHTLNLTQIPRYGKATCFACQAQTNHLPGTPPVSAAPAPRPLGRTVVPVTPRAPKTPTMPSAAEARAVLEDCLIGLERAAQDRAMLLAPDLRAIVSRFLEALQAALALDDEWNAHGVPDASTWDAEQIARVAAACFAPLWPTEGAVLPVSVQVWVLAVDDTARRWQYARRQWLSDAAGFAMMPIIPGITTTNPIWHEILPPQSPTDSLGVVTEVLQTGFLCRGQVVRKARVRG